MEFAVIFDMDGVLVNSHDVIWASHNELLGKHGVHLSDEDIKLYLGKSLRDDIEEWNRKYNLSLDLKSHSEDSWAIQAEVFKKMSADSKLVALLDKLTLHNVKIGVGTSSQEGRAKKILEYLKLSYYFPVIVTANDVQNHKPCPDIFLEAAKKMRIAPERCVVFEDAYSGIEAAKRGNMKAIGYLTGHNCLDELRNADLVIRSFEEVSYEKIAKMF